MTDQGLRETTLDEKIKNKIARIAAYEKDIPAVLIVHDIRTSEVVYMSENGRKALEVTLEELQEMSTRYHDRFFNPEDAKDYVPKILGLLDRNNNEESISFFQQVRPSAAHDWQWHHSATKIILWDDEGKPLLTLTAAIAIDPKHHITAKVERLLRENDFLRRNHQVFASLTRREKEILRLMALGLNSGEMAAQLHISEATAATHRRNIRSKLGAQTTYDITYFAQAFNLV